MERHLNHSEISDGAQANVRQFPPAARGGFGFSRVGALEVTPPRWLIKGMLEQDALALVFGPPAVGKSFLGVDWACSIATGRDYAGNAIKKRGPVLYIAGEGRNGLIRRFNAWSIRTGVSLAEAPLYLSTGPVSLCDFDAMQGANAAVEGISRKEGEPPALIVIDTLARSFGPGDENSTQDMSVAVQALDALRAGRGTTVLVVHHSGHGDPRRGRGSMALKGALDAEYRLEQQESAGAATLTALKMKDAPKPPPLSLQLRSVELGLTDEDGQAVTSAVLDVLGLAPNISTARNKKRGRARGEI